MARASTTDHPPSSSGTARLVALLTPAVIFLGHAIYYFPFIADDALISFRYVSRFVQGKGLTWTDGPAVEGYSNLLWILVLTPFQMLGVDLILAARILGVLCMESVIACIAFYYLRPPQRSSALAVGIGLAFFAVAAPVAVWAIGGLEQPLVALLLAATIPLYWTAVERSHGDRRVTVALALLLGLLCWTRPDSPLFVVSFLLPLLWRVRSADGGASRRSLIPIALVAGAFVGGQLLSFQHSGIRSLEFT